jgi:uncharacterized RDD family membrane protein YckC
MNNYATFWQRFAAMWIDFFVLLPLLVVQALLEPVSKAAALALVIPMAAAYAGYTIFCNARFGQTLGKRVMGIRVIRLSGERIAWREAWLRSSVEVFFSLLAVVGSFVALATIADADYYGVGYMQRTQNLAAHQPLWLSWTPWATQVWVWSEVVVMLFNRRRRALHDFIAGTLVTAEQEIPAALVHAA